ncbi:AraC family transcriptional regulator [Actinomadura sp. DC4]|uniref:AraC family transcriptional regulator n=1 Tax=Actinomadura sp. DC4 TaxID=3055069 RepID=UPI0025AEF330|nr:AraC family transcriptional regulator [Actinomadura sp. DC4]MDN3359146.1 AraC family transcriptional regulator [Actinomadura sp. DC4]
MSLDELRTLIGSWRGEPPIDGLLLSVVDRVTAPTPLLTGPVVALVAQGAKCAVLGDRTYEYGAGQYLAVSVDLPVTGNFTRASPAEPFLGVGLELSPAAIADLLLETESGDRRGVTHPGITVSHAPAELLDAFVRLLRLLDRPDDVPVLAPMIKREILWRLVTGPQGAMVRQIGLADSSLTHVGRAIRWIREHHTETLRIERLAELARMSPTSFHRHFRTVTAMTPVQYQKRIRLHEARLLLVDRTHDVATVGYLVGYESTSQFSREYRRQFGVPPGRDAERLRGATA